MLKVFSANEYLRPAERGINRPIILRGSTQDGETATIFTKTRAGYGDRIAAPGIELFTTLLARELGVTAPEPVLVQITKGFEQVIFDAPEHRVLVEQSSGINFGTIALGTDWKTWPVGMSTRAFPDDMLSDILAFDALVQHTDRHPDNPNMMWRAREIAVLDHEKCFGHLVLVPESQHPWREFLCTRPFQNHSLRRSVPPNTRNGQKLWAELIGLQNENSIPSLAKVAREAFPESELDLARILHYFELLSNNTPDFFEYLNASLEL